MRTIRISSDATALGRLIRAVQEANRWSYSDIARNASAAGRKLSKSRVESLRNDVLPSISVKAIEALAAGLRVAPNRVASAAMESMGYVLDEEGLSAADVLAGDPRLSDPMRRVLLAALEAAHAESVEPPHALDVEQARILRRTRLIEGNRLQDSAADEGAPGPL